MCSLCSHPPCRLLPFLIAPPGTRVGTPDGPFFIVSTRPVAGAAIQTIGSRTTFSAADKIITAARGIATRIAFTALAGKQTRTACRVRPIDLTAAAQAAPQNDQTSQPSIAANGTKPQGRTAWPTGVNTIGTAKPFAWRQITLVKTDCPQQ